jgi:uncharacterized membrane protein YhaH (DUF805 family)
MKLYFESLRKYAVFAGRARRKEYWIFQLCNGLILITLFTIDDGTGTYRRGIGFGLLSALFVLAMFIPSVAVTVRRLHDTGSSGWWLFISLIPVVGPIALLILTLKDSQPGENRYGSNQKTEQTGGTAL